MLEKAREANELKRRSDAASISMEEAPELNWGLSVEGVSDIVEVFRVRWKRMKVSEVGGESPTFQLLYSIYVTESETSFLTRR